MKVADITKWLERMRARSAPLSRDDGRLHATENIFRAVVLQAIADGECDDPAACAREVLKSSEIEFARWCA